MRIRVENPGTPPKARRTRMAKKKTRKNPRKKARSAAQKAATKRMQAARKNPGRRKRRKAAANPAPRRKRRRKAVVNAAPRRRRRKTANPKRPRRRNARRRRARKSNPGWGNVKVILMGLGAGVASAIASAWINDGPLGARGQNAQNAALVVEGIGIAYFVEDPILAAAGVAGLALVPLAQVVYKFLPMLAATPMGTGRPPPTVVVVAGSAPAPSNGNAAPAAAAAP